MCYWKSDIFQKMQTNIAKHYVVSTHILEKNTNHKKTNTITNQPTNNKNKQKKTKLKKSLLWMSYKQQKQECSLIIGINSTPDFKQPLTKPCSENINIFCLGKEKQSKKPTTHKQDDEFGIQFYLKLVQPCCPSRVIPEDTAQDCVQMVLGYLQWWERHTFSGQSVPSAPVFGV